jgi:hypothetical protein
MKRLKDWVWWLVDHGFPAFGILMLILGLFAMLCSPSKSSGSVRKTSLLFSMGH